MATKVGADAKSKSADSAAAVQEILGKLLAKELYIIITSPLRGNWGPDEMLAHLEHQVELERKGVMFGAGPLQDVDKDGPTRGMFIVRAKSFAEAKRIADAEPLHRAGHRTYKLYKWRLNEGSMSFTVNYSDQTVRID
jgi:hypothetical protein